MAQERRNGTPAPRRASKKDSPVLTVFLLAAIILMAGFLIYFFVFSENGFLYSHSKSGKFAAALSENNYQAAATIWKEAEQKGTQDSLSDELAAHLEQYFSLCFSADYTSDIWTRYRGLEVFKSSIEQPVYDKLEEITTAFYRGEYSAEDAKTYLSRAGRFSFASEKLSDCAEEIEHKTVSDKAFAEGSAFYSAGEYTKAAEELRKVSEKDTQKYASAQELLKNCLEAYGKPKLAQAQQLYDSGAAAAAIEILEELVTLFPDFAEAQALLEQCR